MASRHGGAPREALGHGEPLGSRDGGDRLAREWPCARPREGARERTRVKAADESYVELDEMPTTTSGRRRGIGST